MFKQPIFRETPLGRSEVHVVLAANKRQGTTLLVYKYCKNLRLQNGCSVAPSIVSSITSNQFPNSFPYKVSKIEGSTHTLCDLTVTGIEKFRF